MDPQSDVDALRQKLKALGYLDAGVDRFVLGSVAATASPWGIVWRTGVRIGLVAAMVLGPAAAIGLALRLPELVTGLRDAVVVAGYLAVLFGIGTTALAIVASLLVAGVARRAAGHATPWLRRVPRLTNVVVALSGLVYLTLWWSVAVSGSPLKGAWTMGALAVAVLISLLLGHASATAAGAVLAHYGIGEPGDPGSRGRRLVTLGAAVIAFAGAGALLYASTARLTSEPAPRPRLVVVPTGLRLLVFGIDGLDPDLLSRLHDRKPFAVLGRFTEAVRFAAGTDDPAAAWTTIATGVRAEVHGVTGVELRRIAGLEGSVSGRESGVGAAIAGATDLLRLTRPTLSTGRSRRILTWWEVASRAGLRSAAINWWSTWPATEADGQIVSDRATLRLERGGTLNGEIAPPALYAALAASWPQLRAEVSARIASRFDSSDVGLADTLRTSALVDDLQLTVVERAPFGELDALTVYLPGLDILQHTLLGRASAGSAASALAARLDAVEAYYRYLDDRLEAVLAARPGVVPVLVGHPGRTADPTDGLFSVGVPDLRRSAGTGEAVDVAPTLLALLGVPRSRELPGRVLTGLLPGAPAGLETREVPSYGRRDVAPAAAAQPLDEEMRERLRSLGYLR